MKFWVGIAILSGITVYGYQDGWFDRLFLMVGMSDGEPTPGVGFGSEMFIMLYEAVKGTAPQW